MNPALTVYIAYTFFSKGKTPASVKNQISDKITFLEWLLHRTKLLKSDMLSAKIDLRYYLRQVYNLKNYTPVTKANNMPVIKVYLTIYKHRAGEYHRYRKFVRSLQS